MKRKNYLARISSNELLGKVAESHIDGATANRMDRDEVKKMLELELIAKAVALLPQTNSVFKNMKAEDVVNLIAKQAQNLQEDGSVSYLQTSKAAYDSAVKNFDKKLVDAAIKALKRY